MRKERTVLVWVIMVLALITAGVGCGRSSSSDETTTTNKGVTPSVTVTGDSQYNL